MNPKRTVRVTEYDSLWPKTFAEEAYAIHSLVRPHIQCIHHIGSTAVPGLAAKPIIDIILVVNDINLFTVDEDALTPLGYTAKGNFGLSGRRFFVKGAEGPTHHLHAYSHDHIDVQRHLAFRDYLIEHPEIAHAYARLKKACADLCNDDIENYMAGKNEFIKKHEVLAVQWANSKRQRRSISATHRL